MQNLRADLEDLKGTVHILHRFYLEPLSARFDELKRLEGLLSQVQEAEEFTRHEERLKSLPTVEVPVGQTAERVKCLYVMRELKRMDGNRTRAARSLELNVKTLYNLMNRWRDMFPAEEGKPSYEGVSLT